MSKPLTYLNYLRVQEHLFYTLSLVPSPTKLPPNTPPNQTLSGSWPLTDQSIGIVADPNIPKSGDDPVMVTRSNAYFAMISLSMCRDGS